MFERLANLIRGFFGLFISGLERRNPEALLEVETENLRKQIAQYNQGLASHAGLCERLMSQVKKLEIEERDLRAKTSANLRAGNRSAAGYLNGYPLITPATNSTRRSASSPAAGLSRSSDPYTALTHLPPDFLAVLVAAFPV